MVHSLAPGVSAVILAAGANTRLKGIVPSYMKPLILVNGRSLIQHAYDHATKDWQVDQTIIVAGPDNARQLVDVLPAAIDWILQPNPRGVLNALQRALQAVQYERLLILCADNTFEYDRAHTLLTPFLKTARDYIGVRSDLAEEEKARFTRVTVKENGDACLNTGAGSCVWIGPLLLHTEPVREFIATCKDIEELILRTSLGLCAIEMQCADHGIPEELP